jgi:hypothetical protein
MERAFDNVARSTEIAPALANHVLAAISRRIEWRLQINWTVANLHAFEPSPEWRLTGQLGCRQAQQMRGEIVRTRKGLRVRSRSLGVQTGKYP